MQNRIDSIVDFKTVLTKEDLKNFDKEKLEFIKKEAIVQSNKLKQMYRDGALIEILSSRSRELAFLGHKYRDLNNTEKELLAANIVFPNDEGIIKALIAKNISYNQLFSYSRAISSIKKIALYANRLEVEEDVKLTSNKINRLCSLFRQRYGIRDYNLIIAKINEIVIFHRELYKKLEQEQYTSSPKTR